MTSATLVSILALLIPGVRAADWKPAQGPLMTRWATGVRPENVHAEYPRPQLVRPDWLNLNGLWDYAVEGKESERPTAWQGKILVPFPIESALSGVMRRVDENQRLWCRRSFALPAAWSGRRVLLHFGAVDWETSVSINGKTIGTHRGGYDPFAFDITDALRAGSDQEIVVAAWDPTDKSFQPRGKQVQKPHSIWYTPTTGIWQTVWLEPTPTTSIESLRITPDVDAQAVRIAARLRGDGGAVRVEGTILDGDRETATFAGRPGEELTVKIPAAKLWSPDSPFLYSLRVRLTADGKTLDSCDSYFGMRKIALGKDDRGITRIMLNNQPLFQFGPLDQGFWPDGLYTAPSDEALRYDIEVTKRLGFNMARKHVKVEPDRWYYWCDKLGLLVWQDMPSGDAYVAPGKGEIVRSAESSRQFFEEHQRLIESRYNHPSIVTWVPFNEGWGQFETARVVDWVKKLDPSRLVDCASGWNDFPVGDMHDIHAYPGPDAPKPEERRAAVLGEFGGLGLPVSKHTWQDEKNWGYRSFTDAAALADAYLALLVQLHPLLGEPGLSAAVYTQTTDVEIEVNGLMTYDRALVKMDEERIKAANLRIYGPPPKIVTLLDTSERAAANWRYTLEKPADSWAQNAFDDRGWSSGPGGFGAAGTPGAVPRTKWTTSDIWLRREFELAEVPSGEILLRIHHDEEAEVFVNGAPAARLAGFVTSYGNVPLSAEARGALKKGKNVLAVHCRQTSGGQYVDAGLVRYEWPAAEEKTADGWKSLFDGKTLAGWKTTEFAGHNEVAVENGAIKLLYGSELTGVTWTGKPPRINYEIALEAMRVDGHDFFCGLTFPVGDDPCSLIVGGWGGGVVGLSSINGHDASENGSTKYREFDSGRWYKIRLRVTKDNIRAWIDDEQLIDEDIEGKKISIRSEVALSKPLGIASYSTTAALRNIRLRELGPQEAAPAAGK